MLATYTIALAVLILTAGALAVVKKCAPNVHTIMVTAYEDSELIFQALRAGANGYLIKSSPTQELLEAIRGVYSGGASMSGSIAFKVVEHFHTLGTMPMEAENFPLSLR